MTRNKSAWVLNLAKISGIPIRVHLSFFLLLVWIAAQAQDSNRPILLEIVLVLAIFGCVLLHELGHALTARYFGIQTKDIVLYPFGGIASLAGSSSAKAELYIALAGPLVNVLIACLLWPFIDQQTFLNSENNLNLSALDYFLSNLFLTNVALVIFNMIPAIPMDGGRILRAAMTLLRIPRATLIACRISQVLSLLMAAAALYWGNPILLIVAVLVFTNSFQELFHEQARLSMTSHSAADLMTDLERLQVLPHGSTISEAIRLALKSLQNYFPVMYGDELLGVVDKDSLLKAASLDEQEQYISGLMEREYPSLSLRANLNEILEKMELSQGWPLVVLERGRLVGMIFKERLVERLMFEGLIRNKTERNSDVP